MSAQAKRRISGSERAAEYRRKYDSVVENTIPRLDQLNERIDKIAEEVRRSTPVPFALVPFPPFESPPASRVDERRDASPDSRDDDASIDVALFPSKKGRTE